jgi:uncharacterized membrane protein (DUF106 family)
MSKESYADYSIIHKYLQQETLFEEEMLRFKEELKVLTREVDEAKETAADATDRMAKLEEKNNEISRLTATIAGLNKKISVITKGQ